MDLLLVVIGLSAGFFGALLGLGGGMILLPLMVLIGFPIHEAIGTSIVAVVATSVVGAIVYLQTGMTNVRIALTLQVLTTLGAVSGSYIAFVVEERLLAYLFFAVALFTVYAMTKRETVMLPPTVAADESAAEREDAVSPGFSWREWAFAQPVDRYWDEREQQWVTYQARRVPGGLVVSYFAGMLSGLLGIGGGAVQVPVMNLVMGIPTKAAVATSNYMVGITASASAFVYFNQGVVRPGVAAIVALGVACGAQLGARLVKRMPAPLLRKIFAVVILLMAGSLIFRV